MARIANFKFKCHPLRLPPRVLLVDENGKDLEYFTMLLGRSGYAVRPCTNYKEAEDWLEHKNFDVVIVDQGSPAFEAHRLVALVLARNRQTPVVVLTRCLEMESYLDAMQLGAVDYLENPVTPAEFDYTVTTYCQPRQGEVSAQAS